MLPLYVFNKLYAKCQVVLTLGHFKLTLEIKCFSFPNDLGNITCHAYSFCEIL